MERRGWSWLRSCRWAALASVVAAGMLMTPAPAWAGHHVSRIPTRGTRRGSSSRLPSIHQAELTPADGHLHDDFGDAVAISGDTAVVGAPGSYHEDRAGKAYVFVRSGGTWTQQAKLSASDGTKGDAFGSSLAISGDTAVFGEKNHVYVFVRSGTAWSQAAKFAASDTVGGDGFGGAVAIEGDTLLVGAINKNSGTGAAYVFEGSGASWSPVAELTAPDGAPFDYFGEVALSGSTAVIGADGKDTFTGAAYIFQSSGGRWSFQAELTASDAAQLDYFGSSVGVSGSTVLVGAFGTNDETGSAYVFTGSGATWTQVAELTASDGTRRANFGRTVSISGSAAVVGAYDANPTKHTGAAYLFAPVGGTWTQRAKLVPVDLGAYDYLGTSVAIEGATAMAGAPGHGVAGAAYVFS